ncbi:hypothetical protein EKD00_08425 [Chlorobium phaeovibrioides]|uniref:hypothetical protein n=1 Tax=Chlorobium phaeovibrioides TaxID=1094 RepID=UPI000F82D8AF|nr:hypothetical protein [Chlorobium phaeovibrioides]RTY34236.1 hypothetical protein EKD00_08425 [Chlorobium phaeovibrioides]
MGWLKASWAVKAPANYFPLNEMSSRSLEQPGSEQPKVQWGLGDAAYGVGWSMAVLYVSQQPWLGLTPSMLSGFRVEHE